MPIIGHQRNLSCSRHLPNVAKMVPLVRGLCLNADFNQTWSKMSPSLEDFVLLRTLTKRGPKCVPCWWTLSHCRLWPNVVQNVPLVRGLCLTADFDQIWSKHVPLIGGLCRNADFDQMCAVGQWPYLRCGALDTWVQKEEMILQVSDNWKIMRLSGLEMKNRGVWFEIVIRAQEQFQGQE